MMFKGFWARMIVLGAALGAVIVLIAAVMLGIGRSEAAQSHSFFEQFVIAGGPIVWFVLLPMSVVMVFLAAEHGFTIRRKRLVPVGVGGDIVEMIQEHGAGGLAARLSEREDLVSAAVVKAVSEGRGDWFRMRSVLGESLQEQAWCLLRRIEWISLIGNVSPMVGLFGTVFGMIKLFNAIVVAGGQPQPAQLADGISVALVTTFWGLFIAIPAVAIHGVFRNRIEALISEAVGEAENIFPEIRRSVEKRAKKPVSGQRIDEISVEVKGRGATLPSYERVEGGDVCL